jgi:hypothetical protein
MSTEKLLFYGVIGYVIYNWLFASNMPGVLIPQAPITCTPPGGGIGYRTTVAGQTMCIPQGPYSTALEQVAVL